MQDTLSTVLLKLFLNIIDEPWFDILRTKEQLGIEIESNIILLVFNYFDFIIHNECKFFLKTGYTVYSCFRGACGVQGLEIVIQSDKPSQYLNDRAEAFLYHMDVKKTLHILFVFI